MEEKQNSDSGYSPGSGYLAIRDWRKDERPRERLALHGAATLSDAELLAILIGSGSKGFSALDAARELLKSHSELSILASRDISDFKQVSGIGQAKAITLAAAFELAKRVQSEPFSKKKTINGPEDIAAYFIPRMRGRMQENFVVLLLNTANQVFRETVVSSGILNSSIVHAREVFRTAISESAASVILLHNHPSGNCTPSKEDIEITKKLAQAGDIIDIKVLDHVIIAGDDYTSFVKLGLM